MLREDDHDPAQPTEDSERSRLDPFVVATGDAPPRDQRDFGLPPWGDPVSMLVHGRA